MDRIDIFLDIPRIDYEKLVDDSMAEHSENVRSRVQEARARQTKRYADSVLTCNAEMSASDIRQFCKIDAAAQSLMKTAMKQIHFTARGFHRTLKLARTVADLDNSDLINTNHLAEALQYRPKTD